MNQLVTFTRQFTTDKDCIDRLLKVRWKNGEYCPKCGSTRKLYHKSDGRFKCSDCKIVFTWRAGTIFKNSNISIRTWFYAIYLACNHKKGVSSYQLACDLGITIKSAQLLVRRIYKACEQAGVSVSALADIAEVDETPAGRPEKNKHAEKRTRGTQRRSTKTKAALVSMIA